MVRPESVAVDLVSRAGDRPGGIRGRVMNVAFMGNHTRFTVQTDAGTLVAIRFHESDEKLHEEEMVDREVAVWWDPGSSTVVAAGGEPLTSEETGGGSKE
jgi:ABC-type Fe3+/spermidine/putrescine transport system ATPase subunit